MCSMSSVWQHMSVWEWQRHADMRRDVWPRRRWTAVTSNTSETTNQVFSLLIDHHRSHLRGCKPLIPADFFWSDYFKSLESIKCVFGGFLYPHRCVSVQVIKAHLGFWAPQIKQTWKWRKETLRVFGSSLSPSERCVWHFLISHSLQKTCKLKLMSN